MPLCPQSYTHGFGKMALFCYILSLLTHAMLVVLPRGAGQLYTRRGMVYAIQNTFSHPQSWTILFDSKKKKCTVLHFHPRILPGGALVPPVYTPHQIACLFHTGGSRWGCSHTPDLQCPAAERTHDHHYLGKKGADLVHLMG